MLQDAARSKFEGPCVAPLCQPLAPAKIAGPLQKGWDSQDLWILWILWTSFLNSGLFDLFGSWQKASKHLWKKSSRARISLKHKTHKTLKDFKAQRSERNRKTERCRTQKTHLKWPRLHWKKTKEWKRNEARRQEQTQSAAKSESQNQKFSVAPALCGHKASRIRWCPPEPHCRRASQNHSANYTYGEIVCPSDCLAASSTFAFNARNAFDHVLWILFLGLWLIHTKCI